MTSPGTSPRTPIDPATGLLRVVSRWEVVCGLSPLGML